MELQNSTLRAQNIKLSINNRTILNGIDLALPSRSLIALVGPSGCGKSTLLLALAGMQGCIPRARFSGSLYKRNTNDFIGLVFQKPTPFRLSIFENVAIALREKKFSKPEIESKVHSALRAAGIWNDVKHRLKESAHELSGGQLQRLCLARVLALDPSVLLLDEPCSSLDPLSSQDVEKNILEISQTKSVLLVTHNLAQAKRLSSYLVVMWNNGNGAEIIEQGNTAELLEKPQHPLVKNYLSGVIG